MTIVEQDRIWQAVVTGLAGRTQKQAQTGFTNICCPMCVSQGTTADRRHRCGIHHDPGLIVVTCFNCGYKCAYRAGYYLGPKMKEFLRALGTPAKEIARLALWAEQVRRQMVDDPTLPPPMLALPHPTVSLPAGAQSLQAWDAEDCTDGDFLATVGYLLARGDVAASATTYYWSPSPRLNRRLIIPCYQDDRLVGWTARAIDPGIQPRYHKALPSNYLFNAQVLTGPRRYVFIVEGVFDALVVDGVSPLGATLSEQQITAIIASSQQPIVVPDRDAAGSRLIEIAIRQGWPVAIPHYGRHQWWDANVKDVADAVARYGKLYVVQSILATQETHPGKIHQRASYRVT